MGDIRQDHIPEALLGLLSEQLSAAELQQRAAAGGIDFSTMLMGTITWDVSVGDLLNRPMAEAFVVKAVHSETFTDFESPTGTSTPRLEVFPRLFDGKNEGSRRTVHFIASPFPDGYVRVSAGFTNKASWKRPGRFSVVFARKIVPPAQTFVKGQGVLLPFEVKPRFLFF